MHHAKLIKSLFASLLFMTALVSGALAVCAQDKVKEKTPKKVVNTSGRDPFRKYEPSPGMFKRSDLVSVPSIQERIAQYRAQKIAAMNAHVPSPKPTTALLLNEIQVVGVTRTPRGYAAIVEATPIKLSYVIYPGERFFDGQLVAIEDTRLIFRHETVWADGHRDRSVETKVLRQASVVDAMTVAKTTPANAPATAEKKPEDKVSATDKP